MCHEPIDFSDALVYAKEFLQYINPDLWDGTGDKPQSVDTRIYEITINEKENLEISFYPPDYFNSNWFIGIDIVDKTSGDSISGLSTECVNDVDVIAQYIVATSDY